MNSRFFEAISLLPAMHVFLVVYRRQRISLPTFSTVAVQSALLAFLVDCRITARWQVAMIVALGALLVVRHCWKGRIWPRWQFIASSGVWASVVAATALVAHMTLVGLSTDRRYSRDTKTHVVWHEVLRGLLGASRDLQIKYLDRETTSSPSDADGYAAVSHDLDKRNDKRSPIAVMVNGHIVDDVRRGWGEYDRLARNLVFRIILEHPFAALAGIRGKFREQLDEFSRSDALGLQNFTIAALVVGVAGLLWLGLGGTTSDWKGGVSAALIVIAFAMTPPLVAPSALSVGTLLTCLVAAALAVFVLPLLLVRATGGFRGAYVQRNASPSQPGRGAKVI